MLRREQLSDENLNSRPTDGPLSALESEGWRGFLRTQARLQRELDKETPT
jgi:hypothetical protein